MCKFKKNIHNKHRNKEKEKVENLLSSTHFFHNFFSLFRQTLTHKYIKGRHTPNSMIHRTMCHIDTRNKFLATQMAIRAAVANAIKLAKPGETGTQLNKPRIVMIDEVIKVCKGDCGVGVGYGSIILMIV